jgi:hypothetical protein
MQVACPRCGAAQEVGPSGYTCGECGETWAFAACDHCGERFHMRPGTTEWTCPECGTEHGGAVMGELESDRIDDAPTPAAAQAPPAASPARRAPRRAGPPTRGRLAAIAAAGIVIVLAGSFGLSALGSGGGEGTSTPSPSSSVAPSTSLEPIAALCLHLRDLQTLRADALARLAEQLQADADAFEQAGDANLAAKVLRVRTAALAYRDALLAGADLTDATAELGRAVNALPCGA